MPVGVDTNVLVYAAGFGDPVRCLAAADLMHALRGRIVLPVQVLGELYNVLVRKVLMPNADVARRLSLLGEAGEMSPTTLDVFRDASELAVSHGLQIWDAVIVAAVETAGCAVLLSEDMQHGFRWRRTTVVNPFLYPRHPLVAAEMQPRSS